MTNRRYAHRRPGGKAYKGRRKDTIKDYYDNPRVDPQLKQTFGKIGIPAPTPFVPDPFQREALDRLKENDVIVSAPTGAGKTWIASQAISSYLLKGLKAWYASPLKALSNSIYSEFCREFGSDKCGILTGDRKENPDASVIVGTTEILRNQLYDAMHMGTGISTDLVILDEAHYLSDPDRGVVWEEVLIYLPSRVRLLLLSATISNAEELCSWLGENRGSPVKVVRAQERPVSLETLFLFPDGLVTPLAGRRGLFPQVKKYIGPKSGSRRRGEPRRPRFGDIINCLREFDLLPAIFFLKSRLDCDKALFSCHPSEKADSLQKILKNEIDLFVKKYPYLDGHRQMDALLNSLVGSHHAGQLPFWKIFIEQMMIKGYLEVIFSTSTVAAGVNFPARTVVLVQSDRYDGHAFSNLTATELHQMTGRAGRRGKDHIGFAMVIPGLHQDPQLIFELKDSLPEPLTSQIHINFSMTLNLLLSHRPVEVKDLLNRSFAYFQERKAGTSLQMRWELMLKELRESIPKGKCDTEDPYEVFENIQKKTEFNKELKKLSRDIRNERKRVFYETYLKSGRLFLHKNKNVYIVFHAYRDQGRMICAAHNIQRAVRKRRRKIRLQKVPLSKIKMLYDYRLNFSEDYSLERLQGMFDGINVDALEFFRSEGPKEDHDEGALEVMKGRLRELPCDDCEHNKVCHGVKNRSLKKTLGDFRSLAYQMEGLGGGLWVSFKRHLRFLKETGFVDDTDRLTLDGIWASKLRLDHPLLIAEAIRKGGFDELTPEVVAGCIAPFVWDRIQELEFRGEDPDSLKRCHTAFQRILDQIGGIRRLKMRRGFENPPIPFWPGAALYLWARNVPWEELLSFIPIDDGDMASLIVRTADHLRQVANLDRTHPHLASVAGKALDLILREPVLIP